jgi:hypothetical protein
MSYCTISVTVDVCVRPPPDAVITTLYEPGFVCFFVLSVSVEVPDARDAGLKLAVVDFGSAPTDSVTLDENPPFGAIAMEYVVELPFGIVRLAGVAVIVKSPTTTTLTTSVTSNECDTGPLVAVIRSGYVPDGVDAFVETVNVVAPEPVTEAGANAAVAPAGRPVTPKVTTPVNGARVTVAV